MCKETFDVIGLNDQRTAYEVEEFLSGIQSVDSAQADFLSDSITIEYDETQVDQDHVLTAIENAGCTPSDRVDGVLDRVRTHLSHW